ncbi:zinc finger BED domain-containing protein 4 [Ditylenchus destructor]|uniref:Zinc finger BED domain-containing protein 4 n=1 Tax=Ditylenchus destructor TaxID=166010 RepID=A0AAD4MVN7_9BILA|nr:zinc finger BED domain-containing protein 4 [Ditylenchus destructor]
MSLYGKYFTRSRRIANCKIGPCKYEKDLGVNSDTNFLKSHMRAVHKEQYKEFLDLKTKQAERAPPSQDFMEIDGVGEDNRDLILATLLDPRYKSRYLNQEKLEIYQEWLIEEAEKVARASAPNNIDQILNSNNPMDISQDQLFAEYEKDMALSEEFFQRPIPTADAIEARQSAEIQVNEYLRDSRIGTGEDKYAYWAKQKNVPGRNWSLLIKLANRYHGAQATSAESERLFSTARALLTELRKRLTPENAETFLFLHHNLKILHNLYDDDVDLGKIE